MEFFLVFCKLKGTGGASTSLEVTDGQMVLVNHIITVYVQLAHYSRTGKEKPCPDSQPTKHHA